MESKKELDVMLELISQPAFVVQNGTIVRLNQNARQYLLEPGTRIAPLLAGPIRDCEVSEGDCLGLSLNIGGQNIDASVYHLDESEIFVLDFKENQSVLQALQLAATHLRQPLSDLNLMVDRLDSEIPTVRSIKKRLQQIQRMALNMSDAIRYSEEPPSQLVFTDVCSQIQEWMERIEVLLSGCGFNLEFSRSPEPFHSLIDEERLERAINNMISNAAKATAQGGTIQVRLTHDGKQLQLSVRDYGNGTPVGASYNLFQRFRRPPGLDAEGLGLGMTLIRAAATAHGGTLLVTHPTDGGTLVCMGITSRKVRTDDLRSPVPHSDYAGEQDHNLLELSDVLPDEFYK